MAELLTCKERLAAARARLHELMTVEKPSRVSEGDKSIEYSRFVTEAERLTLYIRSLESDPECSEFGRSSRRPFTLSDA